VYCWNPFQRCRRSQRTTPFIAREKEVNRMKMKITAIENVIPAPSIAKSV
jgi:hypothetical protein